MLIDNDNTLQLMQGDISTSDIIVLPLFTDIHRHPGNNQLCVIYIYSINSKNDYVIMINHLEKIYDCDIIGLLKSIDTKIYTTDKKQLLYAGIYKNVIDVTLMQYVSDGTKCNLNAHDTESHLFFKRRFSENENLNCLIPILKHLESFQLQAQDILKNIAKYVDILDSTTFKIYNDIVLHNYYHIEKSGIYIDEKQFLSHFADKARFHLNNPNFIFSDYNIYTRTGRPSNSFAGVNFAGLNKEDGSRSMIQSRFENGMLIEIDFKSYHMFLVSKMVDYKFPTDDIHSYLAKQMLSCEEVSDEEKSAMKQINFELLYSDLDKSIIDNIPFFKLVNECRNKLYHEFKKKGYIETFLFKRKIFMPLDSKLATVFNYYIQSYETEQNVIFIRRVLQYLKQNKLKSRFILYTYDSFLLDMHEDEVQSIKNIVNLVQEFPIKISVGYEYSQLIEVDIQKIK